MVVVATLFLGGTAVLPIRLLLLEKQPIVVEMQPIVVEMQPIVVEMQPIVVEMQKKMLS